MPSVTSPWFLLMRSRISLMPFMDESLPFLASSQLQCMTLSRSLGVLRLFGVDPRAHGAFEGLLGNRRCDPPHRSRKQDPALADQTSAEKAKSHPGALGELLEGAYCGIGVFWCPVLLPGQFHGAVEEIRPGRIVIRLDGFPD